MSHGNNIRRLSSSTALSSFAIAIGVATASKLLIIDPKNDNEEKKEKETDVKHVEGLKYSVDWLHSLMRNREELSKLQVASKYNPFLSRNLATTFCEEINNKRKSSHIDIQKMLRRRQTIIRMNEESTKESLESRYDINWEDEPLGIGAFGTVHLAHVKNKHNESINRPHDTNQHKVAIKKINKQCTDEESFQREMLALLDIREWGGHPNICALREHFEYKDYYYLVLDFIGGGEMFDHLMNNGPYSEADAARLVREVASALAYLHGIGVVHADLKPENLMLSTPNRGDAVVKLVDFGSAVVVRKKEDDEDYNYENLENSPEYIETYETITQTPAYCPPESFQKDNGRRRRPHPSHDMWSLGLILYIMLTGVHPYDLTGDAPEEHVEARITTPDRYTVPLSQDSIYTSHLSESAIDLISKLMDRDPNTRLSAHDMLNHPWVRGETATTDIIAGSDERLNKLKFKMQRKFFEDVLNWSDDDQEIRRKTSLIERSFQSLYDQNKTDNEVGKSSSNNQNEHKDSNNDPLDNTEDGGPPLTMSDFSNLLSDSMTSIYFPKGHIIYNEGDIGNFMYFINSGKIEITTKDGSRATRSQGDFFGEGALLSPRKTRSATIKCKSPVHAMQIPREYFEKYLAESKILITLREKDKIRKRNRAKAVLRLQSNLQETNFDEGDNLFSAGEEGDFMFIVERGKVDITVQGKNVFSVTPGNVCGEHSVLTGKARNTSAVCVSEDGCVAQKMMGRDFRKLADASPNVKDALTDLCRRREFKKSVVSRLKKRFPYQNPHEAFDAADIDKRNILDVKEVADLLREMDPSYTDEEIKNVISSLDLTNSGNVNFDEFKKIFIADIRTSASI